MYLLFCPKRFFLNIWVLSQGIVYWIHYISKNITSCTFLLVFTIVESLQCILKATCCPIISINNPVGVELLVSWLLVLVICVNINLDIIFMILWILPMLLLPGAWHNFTLSFVLPHRLFRLFSSCDWSKFNRL